MKALVVRKLTPEVLAFNPESDTTTLDAPISDEARRIEAAMIARERRLHEK